MCFFVDPKGIGHLIAVATRSSRPLTIQFFVNKSKTPHYECSSFPNQTIRCSSPFDQPFFVRISGVAEALLDLEIEYSVTYDAESKAGCFVSTIPTAFLTGSSSIFQSHNYCVTRMQETVRLVVKVSALTAIILMVAVIFQWLGYWNFCEWMKMPGEMPVPVVHGSISFDGRAPRMGSFGLMVSTDSESSELSSPREIFRMVP
jgi:hypothetical protein